MAATAANDLPAHPGPDPSTPEFLRLMATHQAQIFSYILSVLPNWDDAQEVYQEMSVVLWKAFGSFEPGTNFRAWATKTAYHQVLVFRKRQKRLPLPMSDEFLQLVAAEIDATADILQDQVRALRDCVRKLNRRDAELVRRCYQPGGTTRSVAQQLGRPAGTVYKSLSRIRRALYDCVQRTLATEGSR